MLQTSLSLLMSLRGLRLSSSLLQSLADIFTSRRLILCLQGSISHPPTEKDPGSREGSGEGKQPPVEPRSGKEMELKRQWGGAETSWRLVCPMWLCVPHQGRAAVSEDAGAAGWDSVWVLCASILLLVDGLCSSGWLKNKTSVLSSGLHLMNVGTILWHSFPVGQLTDFG